MHHSLIKVVTEHLHFPLYVIDIWFCGQKSEKVWEIEILLIEDVKNKCCCS